MSTATQAATHPTDPAKGQPPELSIVVVNWNTREAVLNHLETVMTAASEIALEVVVVDNGSSDGSVEAISERFPRVRLVSNRRNAGFARANNQAFPQCRGRYVLLLNPDTEVTVDALRGLVTYMDQTPDAGAAGLQLVHADGRLQNSYDSFPAMETELLSKHLLRFLFPGRYPSKRQVPDAAIEVDIVIGACLILRPAALRHVSGFDDRFFLFVEEADLCYRIRQAGWKIYHLPNLKVRHTYHFSKEQAPAHATIEYYRSNYFFFRKHKSFVAYTTFRALKTLKLVCISLPLSVLAVTLTYGRVARHVRRLKVRSRLASWHVLGSPESWGMRQVSGFRGFERVETVGAEGCQQRFFQSSLSPHMRKLLESLERAQKSDRVRVEIVKRTRSKVTARLEAEGDGVFLVSYYRSRNFFRALLDMHTVPRGLWCFERAVEAADLGVATVLPAMAGCTRRFGIARSSFVAFRENKRLTKLDQLLFSEHHASRLRGYRQRLRAYGRFVRRMHDAGISQYDLNPGNALVDREADPDDDQAIVLVDMERVAIGGLTSWIERKEALARLNRIRRCFTSTDRLRFLAGYFSQGLSPVLPELDGRSQGEIFRDAVDGVRRRTPELRCDEGRRAARNCTRENYFFGRLDKKYRCHFRRRTFPWQDEPILERDKALEMADRVLSGDTLPGSLALEEPDGRSGLEMWRDANRAFQSGERRSVPLLYVRRGSVERMVVQHESGDCG